MASPLSSREDRALPLLAPLTSGSGFPLGLLGSLCLQAGPPRCPHGIPSGFLGPLNLLTGRAGGSVPDEASGPFHPPGVAGLLTVTGRNGTALPALISGSIVDRVALRRAAALECGALLSFIGGGPKGPAGDGINHRMKTRPLFSARLSQRQTSRFGTSEQNNAWRLKSRARLAFYGRPP
jgi:hypothetical protein